MNPSTEFKRTHAQLQLSNPPLLLVLSQVKITPIENIGKYIPEIQDNLRRNGFPKYNKRFIKVANHDLNGNIVHTEEKTDWMFSSNSDEYILFIGSQSLTLVSLNYQGFETFVSKLMQCLNILHSIVTVSGITRIGLRYVDYVQTNDASKPLTHYFKAEILGVPFDEFGEHLNSASEVVIKTAEHQRLTIRCVRRAKGIILPHDLIANGIRLKSSMNSETPFAYLDNDHSVNFLNESKIYTEDVVLNSLNELHDILDMAFRKSVTDDALKIDWK